MLKRFVFLFFLLTFALYSSPKVLALADHVVISEIQIGTPSLSTDEFVELYNPTDTPVSLTGWRLRRRTSGTSEANLVSSISGTLQPHKFFLISHNNYSGAVSADMNYTTSSSIALNNTVYLYDDKGIIIDKVGIGAGSADPETKGTIDLANNGKSVERKANAFSTAESMTTGADMTQGNGEDTDNNEQDFILRETPDPQNSSSLPEPRPTPTLTLTPTPTSTLTPTPTEPEPTSTPQPTPTATPSLTPTPIVRSPYITCYIRYITKRVMWFRFVIPKIFCTK